MPVKSYHISDDSVKSDTSKILEREPELYKKMLLFFKKYEKPNVDLISVTNGPGLEPCLWIGVNFAKALSYFWDVPVAPVNHIESHILVNFLNNPTFLSDNSLCHKIGGRVKSDANKKLFPAIALVVSGGHTQIILMEKIGNYKILGETRDDAAGECFDKCAKILGLGYPGGPAIARIASRAVIPGLTGNSELATQNMDSRFRGIAKLDRHPMSIRLPRPMINSKDYDFSFSGLKTAVLYAWEKKKQNSEFFATWQKTHYLKTIFAKEIQQAIIDVLLKKTIKAVKDYRAKSIILGGGVSANTELRKQFQSAITRHCEEGEARRSNLNLIFPPENLSTDNALMTAITGFYHKKNTVDWKNISANGNLRISK